MKLLLLLCVPCIVNCSAMKPKYKDNPPPPIITKIENDPNPNTPQIRYRRLPQGTKMQSEPITPVNKKESEKDK